MAVIQIIEKMDLGTIFNKRLILILVILIGLIVPFIPSLVVIEMFFLLIPFAILFIATTIYLVVALLNKNFSKDKALFIFSILPIFISSQFMVGFTVDKVQKIRSESIIKEIEEIRNKTGKLPEHYSSVRGIDYQKLRENNNFIVSYSRGFMVTEKYESESKE
ncbi:hypothetical protein [Adhaeribacter terreus]|uniref:Uncharacterized protein n=1 Tax=Adhaeribacter terreus TaxID=529703 RepID=A0ABW0EEM4_9BACT